MKYQNILEEELKNKVGHDYFAAYNHTDIIERIDFAVAHPETFFGQKHYFLWAEAKRANFDIYKALAQLVLTIGKARTFERLLPPNYLGVFNSQLIAFIPYWEVQDIFTQNDFNWSVTPSDHNTAEFEQVYNRVKNILERNAYHFRFGTDDKELHTFIKENFVIGKTSTNKIQITKNNFITIYNKWLQIVKPTIQFTRWEEAKKDQILDADFYLADLLSSENHSLKENLKVVLENNKYRMVVFKDKYDDDVFKTLGFSDNQKAHHQFWNHYQRPPREEYWEYILNRRDLLVSQDMRERQGAYFTPPQWVELSQQYLAEVFGDDWQENYYIWDCAAGTGNLLAGLSYKHNIWASTLDDADVRVMKDFAQSNTLPLLDSHIFQFDFLNDEFSSEKLPADLLEVLNDEQERKKLIIYINPPYAEVAINKTSEEGRINKRGVSFTKIQEEYGEDIGIATKELFAQFLIRIKKEIPNCKIGQFSKLKIVQGPNFYKFRAHFLVDFKKGFACPADTFDNVKGQFPIGFMIWDLNSIKSIEKISLDIYNSDAQKIDIKEFYVYPENSFITDWYKKYHTRDFKDKTIIGSIGLYGSDFQHSNFIRITDIKNHPNRWTFINPKNLIPSCIYLAVRHCIPATWLNDRDQFLYPKDGWQEDKDFQTNCLTYTLFHGQNRISSTEGTNCWIPFTEQEVNAPARFTSHFMTDFIAGKLGGQASEEHNLFTLAGEENPHQNTALVPIDPLQFTPEAQAVFEAGKALWQYYFTQPNANANASLYDIREHFQGRNDKGKMNNKSEDETYNRLIVTLRQALARLAQAIEPKVYQYQFLL